jgi:purine-binding chemotaxis protein CheW
MTGAASDSSDETLPRSATFDPAIREAGSRVLRERARVLARSTPAPLPPESLLQVLEFRVADEDYAIAARYVEEIGPLKDVTPLPGTPPFFAGIVNLRGRILAVVNLRIFFSLPGAGIADLHQIVIVRGPDFELGLLADVVHGLRTVPLTELHPPPAGAEDRRAACIQGVSRRGLIVLDLPKVLSDPRLLINHSPDN